MNFVGLTFGNGKNNRPQRPAGPPEALLDLYEHLLGPTWSIGGGGWPDLLPGQMPADLPVDVPLPEGARLVGSVRWIESAEVIFDCDMSRDEVMRFYERHYLPQGWNKPDSMFPGMGGGFTHTGIPDFGTYFCKGEKDPWLHVRARAVSGEPTFVYVAVSTNAEQSPCGLGQRREMAMMPAFMMTDILPTLRPPEGASQFGGGGSSGGNGSYHSNAELRTGLSVQAVGDHYGAQLEAASWTRTGSGSTGPLAWSSWDFKHENEYWHGLFIALAHPWAESEYKLLLETEAEGARRRRDMMFRRF